MSTVPDCLPYHGASQAAAFASRSQRVGHLPLPTGPFLRPTPQTVACRLRSRLLLVDTDSAGDWGWWGRSEGGTSSPCSYFPERAREGGSVHDRSRKVISLGAGTGVHDQASGQPSLASDCTGFFRGAALPPLPPPRISR